MVPGAGLSVEGEAVWLNSGMTGHCGIALLGMRCMRLMVGADRRYAISIGATSCMSVLVAVASVLFVGLSVAQVVEPSRPFSHIVGD